MLGGFRSAKSMSIAQMRGLISLKNMGLAYGIAESTGGAAIILAPIISGLLYENSPKSMFQVGFVFSLFAIGFTIVFTIKQQSFKGVAHG